LKLANYESALLNREIEVYPFFKYIISNMPDYVKNTSLYLKLLKGKSIVNKSEDTSDVYIVIKGSLIVVNEFESGKTFEPVKIYDSDFIGVVEAILDIPEFISTVQAISPVEYIKIPKDIFLKWIKDNNSICNKVLYSVCKNFSHNMIESGEGRVLDSLYLLTSYILKNASFDKRTEQYYIPETRQKTSVRTGINLRTMYRYINKLKSLNIITVKNRKITYSENQKEILIKYNSNLRNK